MDDGGGVIITMNAIELLKKLNLRPRRTIRVIMWNGEEMGMIPALSDVNDVADESFKKSIMEKIDTMMAKMEEMASNYEDMKAKVAKFSKEPAGQPVRQAKNMINEFNAAKDDYISQLVNVRRSTYKK